MSELIGGTTNAQIQDVVVPLLLHLPVDLHMDDNVHICFLMKLLAAGAASSLRTGLVLVRRGS